MAGQIQTAGKRKAPGIIDDVQKLSHPLQQVVIQKVSIRFPMSVKLHPERRGSCLQDSLRHIVGGNGVTEVVRRDRYRLVQTPQVFKLSVLRRAYEQRFVETFTDDASVVEAAGMQVVAVEGNRENIKLTTPFDLMVAKTLMECWTPQREI